jgi:mercuric ion transport protein
MIHKTPLAPRDDSRLIAPLMVGGAGMLALLSASCCVLPIGLSILGLGGAWLSLLAPFVAWRGAILVVVSLVLTWATVRLIRRPPCKGRRARTFLPLGFAFLAFAASLTVPLWEVEAQRVMWALWQESRS